MKVLWTPEARQDRADIWDYLLPRDGDAAVRIDGLFGEAVARLADFPMLKAKCPERANLRRTAVTA